MKEGHGRAGDWATNLGRLSHGYRGDNIALIVMPSPLTPRSLLKAKEGSEDSDIMWSAHQWPTQ